MQFWLRLINYQTYHIWVFFIKWTQFFIKSAKNGSFFINMNIGIKWRIYTPVVVHSTIQWNCATVVPLLNFSDKAALGSVNREGFRSDRYLLVSHRKASFMSNFLYVNIDKISVTLHYCFVWNLQQKLSVRVEASACDYISVSLSWFLVQTHWYCRVFFRKKTYDMWPDLIGHWALDELDAARAWSAGGTLIMSIPLFGKHKMRYGPPPCNIMKNLNHKEKKVSRWRDQCFLIVCLKKSEIWQRLAFKNLKNIWTASCLVFLMSQRLVEQFLLTRKNQTQSSTKWAGENGEVWIPLVTSRHSKFMIF